MVWGNASHHPYHHIHRPIVILLTAILKDQVLPGPHHSRSYTGSTILVVAVPFAATGRGSLPIFILRVTDDAMMLLRSPMVVAVVYQRHRQSCWWWQAYVNIPAAGVLARLIAVVWLASACSVTTPQPEAVRTPSTPTSSGGLATLCCCRCRAGDPWFQVAPEQDRNAGRERAEIWPPT